ncbi:Ribosomal protein [Parasponia andersonii]|uniref:Ribosomal protein n=1 Tax=Parasponia andersonii TaxID=3476 RepID=A0A2P5B1L3_PARAD|nr:Ribosomal protein [Parasponia andersonii]
MALFSGSSWVSVSSLLLTLFRFFTKFFYRYIKDDCSQMKKSFKDEQIGSNLLEPEGVTKKPCSEISKVKDSEDEDASNPTFAFTFKFPSYEEFSKSHTRNGDFASSSSTPSQSENQFCSEEPEVKSCSNKYEFLGGKDVSFFMEEAKVSSFSVKELYADPNESSAIHSGFLSENDFGKRIPESEAVDNEVVPLRWSSKEGEDSHSGKEYSENHRNNFPKEQDIDNGDKFLSDSNDMGSDSDSESITSSREFSFMTRFMDSASGGFLSNSDFESGDLDSNKDELDFDMGNEPNDLDDDKDEDILEELRKLEESEKFSGKDFESQTEELGGTKQLNGSDDPEKPNEENHSASDNEDSNGLETLWEHQDLVEQLKMELRRVRATGLPTILEESESPKITEDLKPWKIDEKYQYGDRLSELHKLYKSYRERMRKFDILNYQKMYALGFLQSKDPLHSLWSPKTSTLWRYKRKKPHSDQMVKFIRELQTDLEMVYVGQLCLSWEFLQWQYEKAFEIWESDPYGSCQYNEVAGEFQQFQVLLQWFIENEPFQGPRVENYVKKRCVMRNLLQVPVIREDSKERKKARRRGRDIDAITSDMILEILEESIRTIWRFIRADKYANNLVPKSRRGIEVELQDPADSDLLVTVQTELQKKDKKLKEVLRSGNCILKKLRKDQEDSDHLYFFSQVDMKLVSRVLNMSSITAPISMSNS